MQAGYPITAYSACNGLGRDTASVIAGLFDGRSGLSRIPPEFGLEGWCGKVPGELEALPSAHAQFDCRQARMTMLAVHDLRGAIEGAVNQWGGERVALIMATSTGGIAASERAYRDYLQSGSIPDDYALATMHPVDAAARPLAAMTGIRGPTYVVSTACSSSAKVFATAYRLLQCGLVDAVVAGGVDTLCRMTLYGFGSLGVLSSDPCRPFSSERKGINIGEGGAFALVEREGEAKARLLGVGESSDAHHMTQPHPEGLGARLAMERALQRGGVSPDQVDHVNVHGTGTKQNDAGESRAVRELLPATKVVATKGYTGHTLGAAGATELVFAIAAIERGQLPKSLGSDPLDEELGIEVTQERTDLRSRYVLSNSLAFGGSNVSVLIGGAS